MFVFGGDIVSIFVIGIEETFGICVKERHGKMDTFKVSTFDREISRLGSTAAENDRIKSVNQFFCRDIFANFGVGNKIDPFCFH